MSRRTRLLLVAVMLPVLAITLGLALHGLPGFGDGPAVYRDAVNHHVVAQRHVTDAVTAVNFDYRGIDTVGEEFILFVAAASVALVLRQTHGERSTRPHDESRRTVPPTSDAVRVLCLLLCGPTLLLGVYVVAHGTISPGGGFQGGVVLASAVLLVYLAGRYPSMRRLAPPDLAEMADGLGAGGFVAVGLGGLIGGGSFLANVLPLGDPGQLVSGGTIALSNASVGLEVAGGITLILSYFLEQALRRRTVSAS